MRQGFTRATIVMGLTALAAMVAGGREARAILVGNSITITPTSGTVPPTDPQYFYDFQVNLTGYQWATGDYLDVTGLTGLTSSSVVYGSTVSQPGGFTASLIDSNTGIQWLVTDSSSVSPNAGTSYDFKVDTTTITTGTESTTANFQIVVFNPTTGSDIEPSSGSGQFNGGPITVTVAPEPSTLVFLASAAAVAPMAILLRRRRRRSPLAA